MLIFVVHCPIVIVDKYLRLSNPIINSANKWESKLVAWILYSQNPSDFSPSPEILTMVALQYKLLRSSTSQVC